MPDLFKLFLRKYVVVVVLWVSYRILELLPEHLLLFLHVRFTKLLQICGIMCSTTEVPYPNIMDTNEICEIKIFNLYSPSRFWVVVNFESLKVFTNYLNHHYQQKRRELSKIEKLQICMVCHNKAYYRAIVLPVAYYGKKRLRVFLLDYGIFTHVTRENVFCIETKHINVPRFAIRCCLAYIKNLDKSKPWTISELKTFCEIIASKRIFMKIFETDMQHKTCYVDIFRTCKNSLESCSSILVSLGLAAFNSETETEIAGGKTEDCDVKYKRVLKYMHLFPTFQALETGIVPYSLWEHNLLKDCLPKDVLYQTYYEFIGGDQK
ncbi:unnamed protein product [Callosobruchus maculatus]|uniref:Tudor domain-containing protein n=1 Tax=Callosobruchus maculatus TaxID=64391 RepID=A0A653CZI7_CALMS|nr:unnamed protein product [Callosobruchus maculatus]